MSAEIIAWLRSPEGEEWSRGRRQRPFYEGPADVVEPMGAGDAGEDPCGRPPLAAGQDAATERAA